MSSGGEIGEFHGPLESLSRLLSRLLSRSLSRSLSLSHSQPSWVARDSAGPKGSGEALVTRVTGIGGMEGVLDGLGAWMGGL